jgi:GT2 family glycosyltransferase
MTADVSLVLVTFRSSAVAPVAAASFRAEARRCGLEAEIIVVDHSEDGEEAARLRELEPRRLLLQANRGYAAGVNAGVRASTAPTVMVGNPDISFSEGSVEALLRTLDGGFDVVGPQFALGRFLFPPADRQTPGEHLRRVAAGLWSAAWTRRLNVELRRWRGVWEATSPVAVPALAGALLGFRRKTFDLVGPWDEGYFLYFEETDWLRRAASRGLRPALVPAARVEHLWGHAADPEACAAAFARSRARFVATHFGWGGRLASRLPLRTAPVEPQPLPGPDRLPSGVRWWLLSPSPLGLPAAGFLGTAADLRPALAAVSAARQGRGRYLVLAADPGGSRPVAAWRWEASDG